MGDTVRANTVGDTVRANTVGDTVKANTVGDTVKANTVGDTVRANTVEFYLPRPPQPQLPPAPHAGAAPHALQQARGSGGPLAQPQLRELLVPLAPAQPDPRRLHPPRRTCKRSFNRATIQKGFETALTIQQGFEAGPYNSKGISIRSLQFNSTGASQPQAGAAPSRAACTAAQ